MCGIAGFLDLSGPLSRDWRAVTDQMVTALRHRGPDDAGSWADPEAGIALGHARLSVVDVSPQGHQPMSSDSGRYVITFNGEVYNFRALRTELAAAGHRFRGGSDTEVALGSFERWGVRGAVERFNGMFAFAVWDRVERRLHLVRDRLGEKPLYYATFGTTFVFASELKAMRRHPAFCADVDRDVLSLYLRRNCVPAPWSIYAGVRKLPPASILDVRPGSGEPEVATYWSARAAADAGMSDPVMGGADRVVAELDELLRDAVALRMNADVPLGAFLSGGIDSSIVVSLMQAQSRDPVRTFTIGADDARFNEAEDAKAVAAHLGTDHTELYVTARDAENVIPRMAEIYDEPFADSSQIPTFLVAELARRHVTVSLSGDGGDELFAGYNRHRAARRFGRGARWMPRPLRRAVAHGLRAVEPETWDAIYGAVASALPRSKRARIVGDKARKIADVLDLDGPSDVYRSLTSHWQAPDTVVLGAREPSGEPASEAAWGAATVEWMMYLDTITYLPDDILTKLDRATMAVSLEGRVPFLDHRVVEYAWRIPVSLKIRDGRGKWILRKLLDRYVPARLFDRAKAGFGVPIGGWLRGSLRPWAEELLAPARLLNEGYLDPAPIRAAWEDHLAGRGNWQYHLWDVLMFQAWLDHERAPAVTAG